ncbi:thiol-disulfide isomerase/thioredoxin [Mucilaginibacter gracilis]|uniref:Thiol-disulfide isomerase/thioredoxin n=1 Tax=Mucilaginibacter gracilis TaxID=423350 RepID=A0A495IZA5_9SPHI|nr:TlpA disulfide reductase family protein [Mucilaginibacter gracilis]RKR82045.1 thiol-disulfide isomerase/thioredoxin [Mucilaginibacter gracilis]
MKSALTFFFCLFSTLVFPKKTVLIKGLVANDNIKYVNVSSPLRDPIEGWISLAHIPIDKTRHFSQEVIIDGPMVIYVSCLDYVETYVVPGDSLIINVSELSIPRQSFNGSFQTDSYYQSDVISSHSYNIFFSLLEKKTFKMGDLPFLIDNKFDSNYKRKLVKDLCNQRLDFLNDFIKKNPGLSEDFKTVAKREIIGTYFGYINMSFSINPPKDSLTTAFLKEADDQKYDWPGISTSQYLNSAAYSYFNYYLSTKLGHRYSTKKIEEDFDIIQEYSTDSKVKDYFLTSLLIRFLDKEPDNYQEIFEKYKMICKDAEYIKGVTELYLTKQKVEPTANIVLSQVALGALVIDPTGESRTLSSILNQYKNKLIFVDLWASWCGPCVIQIPYLKELENKYHSKIAFISLSEDKSKDDWHAALKKYNLSGNQYLFDFSVKPILLSQLNVKTIPRYILMTSTGEIIANALPKPQDVNFMNKNIEDAMKNANIRFEK